MKEYCWISHVSNNSEFILTVRSHFTQQKPTNAHIYYEGHFINTVSRRHVSALKGPSSGSTTDTFQQQGEQNELPD